MYDRFNLDDILNKKSEFWKKWKLYISPETYYNMTFNTKGQLELIESERLDPCSAENRPFFFNDITTLLRTFKEKIKDIVPLFEKEDRTAVETTYSYIIQFILYKVIIDNNSNKLKNEYDAFREWVQIALKEGDYRRIIKDIKNISEYIYKKVYTPAARSPPVKSISTRARPKGAPEPFRKKQEDINKRLIEQLKKSPTLNDIAPWLDIIIFIDRYNFAGIRNELFGFVYENYLKEKYHDENKGQYFTDPAVVNFMLEELGYTASYLKENPDKISIIDPSCGAGTFLYSAVTEIKEAFNKNTETSSKYIDYITTPANLYYPKKEKIKFIPGSQGMKAFGYKYKIIWKTRFVERFQLSMEEDLLLNNNQSLVISSDNKNEILYLLSILNSKISILILKMMNKLPNESTYLVPISAIKQYIRIPKITQKNINIKKEIIKQTESMLNLEVQVLNDIADFPRTSIQSFDHIRVEGNILLLCKGDKTITAKIQTGKTKITEAAVISEYFPKGPLVPIKEINLEELKLIPAIDTDKQYEIKSYIDNLVFALYFNIDLPELRINNHNKIREICNKNEFYKLINPN